MSSTATAAAATAARLALETGGSYAIDLRRPPTTPFVHVYGYGGKERDGYGVEFPKPNLLASGWVKEPNTQICTNIIF